MMSGFDVAFWERMNYRKNEDEAWLEIFKFVLSYEPEELKRSYDRRLIYRRIKGKIKINKEEESIMEKIWAVVTIIRTSTRMRVLGAIPGTFLPYKEEEIQEYREQRYLFGDEKKRKKENQMKKFRNRNKAFDSLSN